MEDSQIDGIARKFADLIAADNTSPSANVPTPMARIGGAIREALAAMTKERDTLRDEVRAWRAFQEEAEKRSWSKAWYVHAERIADTHDKTDAAGIKGVE